MSICVNRVLIAGNLTRDPVIKAVGQGTEVANFGLALNRKYRTADGEQREDTCFVDIEAWGRTAQLVGQYLIKGSPCLVEGRLKLDQWKNQEGENRSQLRVVADRVQFLPDNRNRNARPAEHTRTVEERGYAYSADAASDDEPLF